MKYILETQNLTKKYNINQDNEIVALDNINLMVQKGEFISIMGPSGSGKTTLLNLISAIDSPTSGEILINNIKISKMNDLELTHLRRKEIGLIFQFYNLIPVLNAYENVELPLVMAKVPKLERERIVLELLDKVGLKSRKEDRPDKLSGGQIQRIAIARSLVNRPSIILADEPTGNLDTNTGDEIMELFSELNKKENQTFLIVTHDTNVANKTNRKIIIQDGKIIE